MTASEHNHGGFRIRLIREVGRDWRQAEAAAIEAGYRLPLAHRSAWAAARPAGATWYLDVRDPNGGSAGGLAIEVNRSRALPGHRSLRIERCGSGIDAAARAAAFGVLGAIVRADPRILRLNVELFSRDGSALEQIEGTLIRLGYRSAPARRRYARTISFELADSDEAMLAALPKKTRRDIRAADKHPVAVRVIDDAGLVPRMHELMRETMGRTGGVFRPHDWGGRMELGRNYPELSRLVGLFRTDQDGPRSLLAFAWACNNGDYAHYDKAASTRQTDLKIPLNYAVAWDLIRWARRVGAAWFDFGGVTVGHAGDGRDPLGGISDFKRYFSENVIDVGREWVLEPRRARTAVERTVRAGVAWSTSMRDALLTGIGRGVHRV